MINHRYATDIVNAIIRIREDQENGIPHALWNGIKIHEYMGRTEGMFSVYYAIDKLPWWKRWLVRKLFAKHIRAMAHESQGAFKVTH